MVDALPVFSLDNDVETELDVPSVSPRPVVVKRNKEGVIDHVGIKLFDRELLSKHPSPVYYFLERYLLELLLLPDNEEVALKLRMERVKITSEVYLTGNSRKLIRQIVSSYSPDCSVYITCSSNRYTVSCIMNGRVLLKMTFPVRHELITGFSKLEAESSVYLSLLNHRVEKAEPLSLLDVSLYKDSLYTYNEDYYAMEDIVSTSYYSLEGGTLVPVFSENRMPESVFNLFNAVHDWGVNVEVTQNMYGGRKQTYSLPLYRLLDYLRKQNCVLYTGIKKMKDGMIEGTLLAVNTELGYQHLLSYKVAGEVFSHPRNTEVKIKMYSYIPIHNVSSLFGDK